MAEPLVSIIAICFNHERFVVECLDSIAAQDHPNVELLILDDCSTDGSVAAIRDWLAHTGTTAELIVHERNRGICATRNEALGRARGRYVACISTDDAWLPGKLSRQVALLEAAEDDVAVVHGDALRVDESGQALRDTYQAWLGGEPAGGDVFEALVRRCVVLSLTTMVRRSCFDAVGGYDEQLSFEDWDMWLRLARRYRFAYDPAIVARYRIVPGSLGGNQRPAYWDTIAALQHKHLGARPELDGVILGWIRRCIIELRLLDAPEAARWIEVSAAADRSWRGRAVRLAAPAVGPWLRPGKRALRSAVAAARAATAGRRRS